MTTRIPVHVTPRSRVSEIRASRAEGIVRLRVIAPPEDGRANEAVIAMLSRQLGVPRRAIAITSGAGSRRKWIEIEGLEEAELWRRLEPEP